MLKFIVLKKLFFFGHHKCATSLFNRMNIDLMKFYGKKLIILNQLNSEFDSINEFYEFKKAGFLNYNNAKIDKINLEDDFLGIHVFRDPRDLIVSAYFSHKYSHSANSAWGENKLIHHRKKLVSLSLKKGLMEEIQFSRKNIERILSLFESSSKKIKHFKLEDIIKDNLFFYKEFLTFYSLGLKDSSFTLINQNINFLLSKSPIDVNLKSFFFGRTKHITHKRLNAIVEKNNFKNLSGGRKKGEEDKKSHFRKGIAGDWKNYFDKDVLAMFNETYPNYVKRLGYQK